MDSCTDGAPFSWCRNMPTDAWDNPRQRLMGRRWATSGVAAPKPLVQQAEQACYGRRSTSHHRHTACANQRAPKQGKRRQKQHTTSLYIKRRPSGLAVDFKLPFKFLLVLVSTLTLLSGCASAQQIQGQARADRQLDLAWKGGDLLFDTSPPPITTPGMPLLRRGSSATATKTTLNADPQATATATSIPEPFDTALGNNFTTSCQSFFQSFLNNKTFIDCHPFSLLLQTSSAFFDASKSFVRITNTLDATCNVNFTTCSKVMNELARTIKNNTNCAADYANDNPTILQAYNGLVAYQPLYQAGCLKDTQGSYCFANAITNTTAVTDSYPYYLPLGVSLPGASRPTCNTCLQDTMAIFSSFAGNTTQPVSRTYSDAAQQIDMGCGPAFVNQTAAPLKAGAGTLGVDLTPTLAILIMLFSLFL